jgi:hypothetical protein
MAGKLHQVDVFVKGAALYKEKPLMQRAVTNIHITEVSLWGTLCGVGLSGVYRGVEDTLLDLGDNSHYKCET